ncbi:MAG: hypothetical protein IJP27_04645 [Clostridia bacterium]|nr:hypothetical protein [Clostridia bacterium]
MNSIYQIALRSFCAEGTLKAGAELLPHVKECGFDTVYLCPVFVADDEADPVTWSPRQRASFTNNPKNPYKIKDYYHVDCEYGNDADLRAFIATAHELGLKVLLDLVYFHCGRNAVFVAEHPDWVEQEEDGRPLIGERWPFARINYQSEGMREYLWENMVTLIRDFDADGFRCDVGSRVPLDFWAEGKRRIQAVKPEAILINEAMDPEYVKEVFLYNYSCGDAAALLRVLSTKDPAAVLQEYWKNGQREKVIHHYENHDIASDKGVERNDRRYAEKLEAFLVLIYTLPGVPMLFNGNEIADTAEQNMFSNRFYGKRAGIDWSGILRPHGQRRLALVKRLNALRAEYPHLATAEPEFCQAPTGILLYRCAGLLVAINLGKEPFPLPEGETLLGATDILQPNAFSIKKER